MVEQIPKVDRRDSDAVKEQVKKLLQDYAADWDQEDQMGNALIAVFARYAEIIIERLNRVPEKNLLAFLDLLGTSPIAPQSARVPLTFALAQGAKMDVIVPAGTQVGAQPGEGEQQPTVFETEQELIVTTAALSVVGVREPQEDKVSRVLVTSKIPDGGMGSGFKVFAGERFDEHVMYLGHHTLFNSPGSFELNLEFDLLKNVDCKIIWEQYDGEKWLSINPQTDTTRGLSTSGKVKLALSASLPETDVNAVTSRWLRCRLALYLDGNSQKLVSNTKLPSIKTVTLSKTWVRENLKLSAASVNALPIDLAREFYPFGEEPKLSDSFYFADNETFSQIGATVTVNISIKDPKDYIETYVYIDGKGNQISRTKPTLVWEYWDGNAWKLLADLKDNSDFLTKTGAVSFTVPVDIKITTINGVENHWLRVRIAAGNYGTPSGIKLKTDAKGEPIREGENFIYTSQPSTLVPPLVSQLSLSYTFTTTPEPPQTIFLYNDFHYEPAQQLVAFTPFVRSVDEQPALYLGFNLPEGRAFPKLPLSMYAAIKKEEYQYTTRSDAPVPSGPPQLVWEYWNGTQWNITFVQDDTHSLSRSGLIVWLPPSDIQMRSDFGLADHYWLRVRLAGGGYRIIPQLQWLRLNTTMAVHTVTLTNEVLGSSNENQVQRFRTTQVPVLNGQQLEIEEIETPAADELAIIKQEEGDDAIRISVGSTIRGSVWVRWHEVPDFHGSGPRSRHYVIDRMNGEIRFGDGINGLIPPRGIGNIRLAWYQTGGGRTGNKPVGTITQLQSTLPYIDSVTNYAVARGGADAETQASVMQRSPKNLRHRFRAVTAEDYEDLALQSSFEVARALCVPLLDIEKNPLLYVDTEAEEKAGTGQIGVIIVPRSLDSKPLPDQELIDRVRDYLSQHAVATANITVAGPLYLSINVDLEIVLLTPDAASAVQSDVLKQLNAYLHPLTGTLDGNGWPFGEYPQESDIYRLISNIQGIDYVNTLKVRLGVVEENRDGKDAVDEISKTRRFLIYSGNHNINLATNI